MPALLAVVYGARKMVVLHLDPFLMNIHNQLEPLHLIHKIQIKLSGLELVKHGLETVFQLVMAYINLLMVAVTGTRSVLKSPNGLVAFKYIQPILTSCMLVYWARSGVTAKKEAFINQLTAEKAGIKFYMLIKRPDYQI